MTVVKMVKVILHDKDLPYYLWVEAIHTTVYILNKCPIRAIGDITPFQAYSGRKPGIPHFKVFGSLCYTHIPSELRQKLDVKSTKDIFVGYATYEKSYKVYDPTTKKLILSRDVVFNEGSSWNQKDISDKHVTMTNCRELYGITPRIVIKIVIFM